MSNDSNQNEMNRNRRGSVTSQAFAGLFRSNSTSTGSATIFPNANMTNDPQRRRLSISTGLGLSGSSPTSANAFNSFRRGSLSTSSDSIDENAIDEEEMSANSRTTPNTPFTRRMSFGAQAMRNLRTTGGGSPGSNDQGFNWSEQLRSRAESTVQGSRPSFSFGTSLSSSPPRANGVVAQHDRAKSVSDMPAPPGQAAAMKPKAPEPRQKPDAFQERILKGDFYMD